MKSILSSIAIITVIIMGATVMTARGQSGFETEPVLKAKDLVAPELLKGPHFTVDDRVPVKGFLAYFTIRSDYGTFEAHGIHMFQIRVKEVYALAQLDDMSKTKEFAEAAGRAIARPVTSTVHMLVNPVETMEGFPGGVTRLWDRIKLGSEKVAEAATAPGASGGQKVADVSERVGGITVTALGYEKERRDLAKGLGVDPYTTNPVLSKKLSDMAWVAFSGRFGIQAAMSVLVPYSMAMSAVTITNTTVYDTPQGDLINKDQAIFAETGASEAQVQAHDQWHAGNPRRRGLRRVDGAHQPHGTARRLQGPRSRNLALRPDVDTRSQRVHGAWLEGRRELQHRGGAIAAPGELMKELFVAGARATGRIGPRSSIGRPRRMKLFRPRGRS